MKVTTRNVKFRDENGRMVDSLIIGNGSVHDEVNTWMSNNTAALENAAASATGSWLAEHITQPSTPAVDTSLKTPGAAADSAVVGQEIGDLKSALDDIEEQIEGGTGSGLTSAIKSALLQLAQKVAYIDEDGQTYYDDLYDALYAVTAIRLSTNSLMFNTLGATQQLTATTTPEGGAVTWASSNTSVATVSSTGLVTSVGYGNATITATSGSVSATCSVAIAQVTLTSISASYTQSGTVYDSDLLDDLKNNLVVTAHWSNSSTSVVESADYTLSGTLTAGTSTITVSYGGKTATFNVTVTADTREYIYYDYLKGDGTAFIDTNLSAKTYGADSYKKYFRFAYTEFGSPTDAMFGARNRFSYTGYYVMGSAAPKIRVCLCATYTDITIQLGTVHEVLIDNKKVYFDGSESYSGSTATTTITSTTMTMPLFANVTGDTPSDPYYAMTGGGKALGFSKVKLYEFKLSDANDNVIADMIPARRKSDNAIGMHDIVRDIFFENARSDAGTFTLGND